MAKNLFVFLVSCAIWSVGTCGNDSSNPFGLQLSKSPENPDLGQEKKFLFDEDSLISEDKNLEKRRLFYPDSTTENDNHSDNSNSRSEHHIEEHKVHEDTRGGNHWDSDRHKFQIPEVSPNVGSPRHQNRMFEWERTDGSEKTRWNEEKSFRQYGNLDHPFGSHYERQFPLNNYSGGRNSNFYDKRVSMTMLNDPEMRSLNKYGEYGADEMHSGYQANYRGRKENGHWDPKYLKPEKGVIINFNTECPVPRQYNNQLVHRVVISPKSQVNTESEVSAYQYPGTSGFLSAHHLAMNPYYL